MDLLCWKYVCGTNSFFFFFFSPGFVDLDMGGPRHLYLIPDTLYQSPVLWASFSTFALCSSCSHFALFIWFRLSATFCFSGKKWRQESLSEILFTVSIHEMLLYVTAQYDAIWLMNIISLSVMWCSSLQTQCRLPGFEPESTNGNSISWIDWAPDAFLLRNVVIWTGRDMCILSFLIQVDTKEIMKIKIETGETCETRSQDFIGDLFFICFNFFIWFSKKPRLAFSHEQKKTHLFFRFFCFSSPSHRLVRVFSSFFFFKESSLIFMKSVGDF